MNRRLCWRNEGCVWIVQGGDREQTSEISQGYSVLKSPVISGLMSSHLKHGTAVYFIWLKIYLNNQTPKITLEKKGSLSSEVREICRLLYPNDSTSRGPGSSLVFRNSLKCWSPRESPSPLTISWETDLTVAARPH